MKLDEITPLAKLEACFKDVKVWMNNNFLLLNTDKTEVMDVVPQHLRGTLSSHQLTHPTQLPLDGLSLTSNPSLYTLRIYM